MNRRNAIKAAIAGVAAAVGWKVAKPQTITLSGGFDAQVASIQYAEMFKRGAFNRRATRELETRTFSVDEVKRIYRIPNGAI